MYFKNNLKFSVGALLYSPAANDKIADFIINEKFGKMFSLALCLEDTINDISVDYAEKQLIKSLKSIKDTYCQKKFYIPKIFIRVRYPKQVLKIFNMLNDSISILTGFIFPKFCINNAFEYIKAIKQINDMSSKCFFIMPILEDSSLINLINRRTVLYDLKKSLDSIYDYVLNIRVGGNDLCNAFGIRRNVFQTIYDIMPVSSILSDILSVFSLDYVVSGAVWEYFNEDTPFWKKGLEKELKIDMLNGFIGKTVIHPNQIPVINNALKVSQADYNDAMDILNWDSSSKLMVSKSRLGRMNEFKTHFNWANKIKILADIYGIK